MDFLGKRIFKTINCNRKPIIQKYFQTPTNVLFTRKKHSHRIFGMPYFNNLLPKHGLFAVFLLYDVRISILIQNI